MKKYIDTKTYKRQRKKYECCYQNKRVFKLKLDTDLIFFLNNVFCAVGGGGIRW